MIAIQQDTPEVNGLVNILASNGETEVILDINSMNEDISRLKTKTSALNKNDKHNLEIVIAYLDRLKHRANEDDTYRINWYYEDFKIKAYPLDLRHYNMYSIKATDYIVLGNKNLIKIDYTDTFKIMAFDIMFNEFDEDFHSIEDKLKNIGVTGIYDCDNVTKYIPESIVDLSKYFRIGKSPYSSLDEKVCFNYFGSQTFNDGKYAGCVGSSIDQANSIITANILNRCTELGLKHKLCAVNEDGIYLLVEHSNYSNIQNEFESVVVRAFGRRFEVKPTVTVF